MDFKIFENSIIICDNEVKDYILSKTFFLNASFKSYTEAVNDILGEFDDLTFNIKNEKNVNFDLAQKMSNSLLFGIESNNNKLNELNELKNKFNNNYKYIKPINYKNVFVVNYDYTNDLLNYALKRIDYKYISLYEEKNISTTLYSAPDRFQEVFYVFNSIAKILEQENEKIYIFAPSDYNEIIKEYSFDFDIDVIIEENVSLYDLTDTKNLINKFDETLTVKDFCEKLVSSDTIYYPIINKINSLDISNLLIKDVKDYFIYILKHTYIEKTKYEGLVYVTKDIPLDAKYVFILGMNQGINPNILTDTNYITDNELEILNIENTFLKNIKLKENFRKMILNTEYVYLSNSKTHNGKNLEKSLFLNTINYIKTEFNFTKIYSEKSLKKLLSKLLDNYYKYNELNPLLDKIYNTIPFKYNSYDNDYKGNATYKPNHISYSSLNTYLGCPFSYFLEKIVKLETKSTIYTKIGNYFHAILERAESEDDVIRLSEDIMDELNIEKNHKNYFIYNNFNEILKVIIKQNNSYLANSCYSVYSKEKEVKMQFDETILEGKIDLILANENDAFIIDYKTGNKELKLSNLMDGVDLQIPIYMLFLEHLGFDVCGAFIKRVVPDKISEETFEHDIYDYTRLDGYFTDNISKLSQYHDLNSINFKSFKLKKDGTPYDYTLNRMMNKEKVDEIISFAKDSIRSALNNMESGKFNVNPAYYDDNNNGCTFCNFSDICYKKKKNLKRIIKLEEGENNAVEQ